MTVKLSNRAAELKAMVEAGRVDKLSLEMRTDDDMRALREAGYTVYGTPAREECQCWFYERNAWQHDCLLDVPQLPIGVAASLLIRLTFLDGHQGTYDPEPLFLAPEEIVTFANVHETGLGWDTAMLMSRLAEQARWGRLGGRKMAMVHDVPGLDPDYVSEAVEAVTA